MALNLKNSEVEQLAGDVAIMAGTSKTEAIRQALLEKKDRLQLLDGNRNASAIRFLQERLWPTLPVAASRTLSREEEEAILGYGPEGAPV